MPWHFWQGKSSSTGVHQKVPPSKELQFAVTPLVLTPFVPFSDCQWLLRATLCGGPAAKCWRGRRAPLPSLVLVLFIVGFMLLAFSLMLILVSCVISWFVIYIYILIIYLFICIHIHIHIHIYLFVYSFICRSAAVSAGRLLGCTTCPTLLVQCGLVCCLRHLLSNTANLICCIIHSV